MTQKLRRRLAMLLPLTFLVAACGNGSGETPPTGEIPRDYYKGKTITWIISGSAGGGTDLLTRSYAPFLSKYLPGNPEIEFKYMEGGGGIEATNYLYNVAKPDGLTIGTIGSEPMMSQLLGEEGVQYEFDKLTFLGNFLGRDQMLWLRGDFGVKTFEELLEADRPAKIGARSTTHPTAALPLVLDAAFPQELFTMVYGYDGGSDVTLDVERGALDGRGNSVGSLEASHMDWIESGFLVPLVYVGKQRHADFPDVPTIDEVIPAEHKDLVNLLRAPDLTTRAPVATPNLPDGIVALLRDAIKSMSEDPELQKTVVDLGYPFLFTPPEEIQETAAAVLQNETLKNEYRQLTEA